MSKIRYNNLALGKKAQVVSPVMGNLFEAPRKAQTPSRISSLRMSQGFFVPNKPATGAKRR